METETICIPLDLWERIKGVVEQGTYCCGCGCCCDGDHGEQQRVLEEMEQIGRP